MKNVFTLALNQTGQGVGNQVPTSVAAQGFAFKTFQSTGQTSSGTGSAVIAIEASNDGSNWVSLGNVNLTLGVATTTLSMTYGYPWGYYRANITTLTGTGASVNVYMAL